ncbi:MAG: hypothetical protein ABSA68_11760 [Xanthobacteraceae bacterium]|jgi:hypothetical protein
MPAPKGQKLAKSIELSQQLDDLLLHFSPGGWCRNYDVTVLSALVTL